MNLLQLHQGHKSFGAKTLFDEVSFSINEGEHIGVIGPNGAGKTTLFKILVGREQLDSGEIVRTQNLRIGYLEQEAEWNVDLLAEDFLTINSIRPIWELKQLGLQLGLKEEHFRDYLKNLSGGYRMRMKLLHLIGQEPHLLLLDEPTNFLDLESILALENFLQDYKGAFLLISHDREFLRRVTESTLEIELGDITKFPGNIDDYFEQKVQIRAVLEAQAANQSQKRKQVEDFVRRFGAKATKARQAQSRMKQLEKMEVIEIKSLPTRARIRIPAPRATGKAVLNIENAKMGYTQKMVLDKVGLRLERGDHLGVVGINGAGKSTLLKSLAGKIPLLTGIYSLGFEVTLGYFSQHSADQLDLESTVIKELEKCADSSVTRQEVLDLAGCLLFSGDDINKRIKVLSGGEKSRVALGQVLLQKCPLLILDEPTNHLDFDTVEALTESLKEFPGTVIVVSHDRSFISRVATKILEIDRGKCEFFPGTYDDYVWSLQKGILSSRLVQAIVQKKDLSRDSQGSEQKLNYKDESKRISQLIKDKERSIKKIEDQLKQLEQERLALNDQLMSSQGKKAQEVSIILSTKSELISTLEEALLSDLEELEKQQVALNELKR
jgi:ATP-binding cassette subfamily F protein 3